MKYIYSTSQMSKLSLTLCTFSITGSVAGLFLTLKPYIRVNIRELNRELCIELSTLYIPNQRGYFLITFFFQQEHSINKKIKLKHQKKQKINLFKIKQILKIVSTKLKIMEMKMKMKMIKQNKTLKIIILFSLLISFCIKKELQKCCIINFTIVSSQEQHNDDRLMVCAITIISLS